MILFCFGHLNSQRVITVVIVVKFIVADRSDHCDFYWVVMLISNFAAHDEGDVAETSGFCLPPTGTIYPSAGVFIRTPEGKVQSGVRGKESGILKKGVIEKGF